MDNKAKLTEALSRFQNHIEICGYPLETDLNALLEQRPRLSFYITRIFVRYGASRAVYEVTYRKTDVKLDDIYVVTTQSEAHDILCRYVGNYRQRLVIIADKKIDVMKAYEKFKVVDAPFYSNYRGIHISSGSISGSSKTFYDFTMFYRIGKVMLSMMKKETDAEVKRLVKQMFLPGMRAETKILLANNYLASTITYTKIEDANPLEASYIQSAYGALIKKKCVCQGYAEAFKLLMDAAKIPCDIVCGENNGSTTHHAWNVVKLNGGTENYHVDVTWGSYNGELIYDYFGKNDSELALERTWNREYTPKCNSTKNLLSEARKGIKLFRAGLIRNGVDPSILKYS